MEEILSSSTVATPPARRDPGSARFVATVKAFQARLCASDSATETLRRHCAERGIASDPAITARRIGGEPGPSTARQRLRLDHGETERYRRVHLMCGEIVLCEAEIWYVPARLPDRMNRALDTSDAPFGRIVAPLGPTRITISSRILRTPEAAFADPNIPRHLVEHRALVLDRRGLPLAEVGEHYMKALFPAARAASG